MLGPHFKVCPPARPSWGMPTHYFMVTKIRIMLRSRYFVGAMVLFLAFFCRLCFCGISSPVTKKTCVIGYASPLKVR